MCSQWGGFLTFSSNNQNRSKVFKSSLPKLISKNCMEISSITLITEERTTNLSGLHYAHTLYAYKHVMDQGINKEI